MLEFETDPFGSFVADPKNWSKEELDEWLDSYIEELNAGLARHGLNLIVSKD